MNMTVDEVLDRNTAVDAFKSTMWRDMGADGVHARTGAYEDVIDAIATLITKHRPADTEVFRFPPVMSRGDLQKAGYFKSFPQLLGCVCCLTGDEDSMRSKASAIEGGDDPTSLLSAADLVLTPAACYPIYPIAASRGPIGRKGLFFDVACDCFRREPSRSVDRLQSFRMREYVRIGSPEQVAAFREEWIARAQELADEMGLSTKIELASDPFFGRGGQLTAISQIQQSLKFELLIPINSEQDRTACMSFNYHRDHFGDVWGLRGEAGQTLHTGCVAFGMDRLAVALFVAHGVDTKGWPARTRTALGL
jgi:seryl-tRNA synthetase